jgi:hypothetical protein
VDHVHLPHAVGSVGLSHLLLLLPQEAWDLSLEDVSGGVLESLLGSLGSCGVLDSALALVSNASPVHGPSVSLEAPVDYAGLVAVGVGLEGLEELSVVTGNWLQGSSVVQLCLVQTALDDL